MEQKIVSTFMFSEPHEHDLLWLKFNIEDPFVHQWVITESCYTFQGKHKPIYIHDVLSQDRFAPFRHKIHVIELDRNTNFEYEIGFVALLKRKVKRWLNEHRGRNYELVPYAEHASFHAEITQRQACVAYLSAHYSPEDIVIACDTDEIFDFNDGMIELLEQMLATHPTVFYIRRLIFCYDYDNLTARDRFSPIVRLKELTGNRASMHQVRHPMPGERVVVETSRFLAYEYTFCFSKVAIAKKLSAFAHVTDLDERALDFCLSNNVSLINPNKISDTYCADKENFYRTIELDAYNAPSFLRQHFDQFKTGVVSPDYVAHRKQNHLE